MTLARYGYRMRPTRTIWGNMRSIHFVLGLSVFCLVSASATAEPFTPQVTVGVVPYAGVGDGTDYSASGDVIDGSLGLGVLVEAGVRLWPHASLGLVAGGQGWGRETATVGPDLRRTTLWRAAAEGRWHILLPPGADLWLAAEVGGLAVHDELPRDPASSSTEFSPAVGAATGVDWPIGAHASVGFEVRGVYANVRLPARSDPWAINPAPKVEYRVAVPISIGLALRWRI